MSRPSKPARRLGKWLLFALVVHVFVIPQIGGDRKALSVIGSIDPLRLVMAIGLEVAGFVAYARLTQLLVPREHRPSLPIAFGAVMASTGVNHVVPGGAAKTVAVNFRLLGQAGVPRDQLAFALGTQAIGSAVVLNLLLWFALVASVPASGFHPVYATAAAVGAVLIGLVAAAVIGLLRGRDIVADRVARATGRLPRVDPDRVGRALTGIADQLAALSEDRRRLMLVSGFAATNWILDAAALYVSVPAFAPRPSIVGLLVAFGLANVLAAAPVSPGGLGVIEAILIPTIVGFGTPRAQASIAVVVYRLVNFWMPIPVGGACYIAVGRIAHRDEGADDADPPLDRSGAATPAVAPRPVRSGNDGRAALSKHRPP